MPILQSSQKCSPDREPGVVPACWYAVATRSHFEHRVSADLAAKGVEQYLPLLRETHRWKDRKKLIEVPLFTGYVFVRFPDSERARLQVLRTVGAVRILGLHGAIEPIAEVEIESIRQLLRSNLPLLPYPFLREGTRVRIKRGPLEGIEGFLLRAKSQSRIVLSVELLSQSVAAEVDFQDVEATRQQVPGGDVVSAKES